METQLTDLHIVTGAFGYSGKYIAARLLRDGQRVRTITQSLNRSNPFGGQVEARPFNFDAPEKLVESLRGAMVLYNTYWVRFNYRTGGSQTRPNFTHALAVENTRKLFDAAKRAGVERVVHVSITNPSEDSPLEYFSGKGTLERALIESGLSYAILRPTVVFGPEDILINNIAWTLRHLPVFGVFGDGEYKLQPIYVDDLAALAVEQGKSRENRIIDAIGSETFTYRELVRTIGEIIGARRLVIGVPPWFGYAVGAAISRLQGDVFITREEIDGLMRGLLCTDSPPAGATRLTDWARAHAATLGVKYASELARRRDRDTAYGKL
ncbi:MAG: NAD(P)H-binding protein [Chloroflexota bacterium]|nr:NAD(P)H-binding protein [Chloroflexota bacterium]